MPIGYIPLPFQKERSFFTLYLLPRRRFNSSLSLSFLATLLFSPKPFPFCLRAIYQKKKKNLSILASFLSSLAMAGASVAIDWGSLDDDFAEVVVVPSFASATTSTSTFGGTPELAAMSDHKLREKIQRLTGVLKDNKCFPDRGEKARISLTQCQDELRRRETTPFPKVCCENVFSYNSPSPMLLNS